MRVAGGPVDQGDPDGARDVALVRALARGDDSALAELYDRHIAALMRTAVALLGDPSSAEDLLHDVLLEARARARQYDSERGSVRSWLLVRVRSRALDRLRSLRLRREHAARLDAATPDSDRVALPEWSAADRDRITAAVEALPAPQRELVELAYFEGLTHAEMASRCGIPVGTVKSRLNAAMSRLRGSFVADPAGGAR